MKRSPFFPSCTDPRSVQFITFHRVKIELKLLLSWCLINLDIVYAQLEKRVKLSWDWKLHPEVCWCLIPCVGNLQHQKVRIYVRSSWHHQFVPPMDTTACEKKNLMWNDGGKKQRKHTLSSLVKTWDLQSAETIELRKSLLLQRNLTAISSRSASCTVLHTYGRNSSCNNIWFYSFTKLRPLRTDI